MQSVQFYYISSLILISVQSPFKKRQTNGDETDWLKQKQLGFRKVREGIERRRKGNGFHDNRVARYAPYSLTNNQLLAALFRNKDYQHPHCPFSRKCIFTIFITSKHFGVKFSFSYGWRQKIYMFVKSWHLHLYRNTKKFMQINLNPHLKIDCEMSLANKHTITSVTNCIWKNGKCS